MLVKGAAGVWDDGVLVALITRVGPYQLHVLSFDDISRWAARGYIGSSQAMLVSAQANTLCHLHGVTLTLIVLNLFLEMSFMETHDADR